MRSSPSGDNAAVTLGLEDVRLDDPIVSALTSASVEEMDARYGGEPGSGPTPLVREFLPPDGAFVLARIDGRPAGCGGISRLDAETAEVRRMYVAPAARGRGVAKAILERLLDAARELGYTRARLETGNRQPEALGLYRRAGFEPVPCWGPFVDDPRSLCFELDL